MRLEYKSRTGHFNFCDPGEESVSCNIRVYNDESAVIKSVNCHPESEEEGDDVDEAIEILENADKKVLYSTSQKEWKEMVIFLRENKEEIEKGNKEWEIKKTTKEIQRLQEKLRILSQ